MYSVRVLLQALLSSTRNLRKPFLYDFLAGWLGKQSMVLATGSIWRFKRKLMTPAFHFRILENYMAIFNQNADLLVRRLCSFVDKAPSEPIRLFENTQKCALDIIGEVTMGAKLHVQEGKNLNFMSSFNSASLLVGLRALRPWLWLQFIYDRTPEGKLFKKNMKEIESFTHLPEKRDEGKRAANSVLSLDLIASAIVAGGVLCGEKALRSNAG
ncbi:cytochrome P450 4V2 [Ixodes scapularis]